MGPSPMPVGSSARIRTWGCRRAPVSSPFCILPLPRRANRPSPPLTPDSSTASPFLSNLGGSCPFLSLDFPACTSRGLGPLPAPTLLGLGIKQDPTGPAKS